MQSEMRRVMFFLCAAVASVLLLPSTARAADYDTLLEGTDPSLSTFYPFVVDGYRDTVWVKVGETSSYAYDNSTYCDLNATGVSEAVVIDANDAIVRHLTPSTFQGSDWEDIDIWGENGVELDWDGKNDADAFVRKNAYYRFRLTGTPSCWSDPGTGYVAAGFGDTETITSSPFFAARKTLVKDATKVLSGSQPTTTAHSSHCTVWSVSDSWIYPDMTRLQCRGGEYAFARYVFHIPSNSFGVTYAFKGGGVYYGPYYWKPSAVRTQPDKVVFKVRVGGYIKYNIYKVRLTYSYKQQL